MTAAKFFDGLAAYVLAMQVKQIKKATKYVSDDLVVKISLKGYGKNPEALDGQLDAVVTVGRPNAVERKFIQLCKEAGEPLPVKKVQLKFWKEHISNVITPEIFKPYARRLAAKKGKRNAKVTSAVRAAAKDSRQRKRVG